MERLIVACVQERMRVFATIDHYRHELQRFLRIAQHKHASLVIFPELGGTMLAPPLLRTFRLALLKRSELGRRRGASPWQRLSGRVAYRLAGYFTNRFTDTVAALLAVNRQELWPIYCELFGGLAREFQVTLVAPSAYLPDPADGVNRNLTAVFSPTGDLCGYQAKVLLHHQDQGLASPGTDWQVIATPVGRLGLLVGNDGLYPEIGRLLAYRGAEMLIAQGACETSALYQKLRAGILARMQENQLFAAASFLVGVNEIEATEALTYVGRSAIFAPQELTPRLNGILVEMGSPKSEGVLSAEWNFVTLKKLWELSDTPVRKELPFKQIGRILESLQARLLHGSEGAANSEEHYTLITPTQRRLPTGEPLLRLDDLPITSTITRRWPPKKLDYATVSLMEAERAMPALPTAAHYHQPTQALTAPSASEKVLRNSSSLAEDETEEMDAVPDGQDDS